MEEREKSNIPPALTHGVGSAITHGDVPEGLPGAAQVRAEVDGLLDSYVSDLGGPEQITAGQRVILSGLRLSLIVLFLGSRYLTDGGLLDAKQKPKAVLNILNSYSNSARLHALALGLGRNAKSVETLESVLEEYAEKKAES